MKLKRFFASDMRQALRLVREEQGPDAVILSNQRVDGGIEIIAAVDYDPVLAQHMLTGSAAPAGERRARADEAAATAPPRSTAAAAPAEVTRAAASQTAPAAQPSEPAPAPTAAPGPNVETSAPPAGALGDMQRELAE